MALVPLRKSPGGSNKLMTYVVLQDTCYHCEPNVRVGPIAAQTLGSADKTWFGVLQNLAMRCQ